MSDSKCTVETRTQHCASTDPCKLHECDGSHCYCPDARPEQLPVGVFFDKLEKDSKCVRCGVMTAADVIICSKCAKIRTVNT